MSIACTHTCLGSATRLIRGGGIALIALLFAACVSDKTVVLRYPSDLKLERRPSARAVTVFRFSDRRGDEGDSNPLRVGGIYGGYGNRLAKVYATTPWPEALVEDLATALGARGVETVAVKDQEYATGRTPVSTPLALAGEIRNFSTETRFTLQAHVSGIIRLYNQQGTLLLEKELSARMPRDSDSQWDKQASAHENMLNGAVRYFIHLVVMDSQVMQLLTSP